MSSSNIRIIAGLGNPGKKYVATRHNVGYRVAEALAASRGAKFKAHSRIPGMIAEWKEGGIRWICLKPITFMNLSGQAISATLNFFEADPSLLLTVVDDVELSAGSIRLRQEGGAGGHNGLKSIIEQLDTKDFGRLRVGIGRPEEASPIDLSSWVLMNFEKTELIWLEESIKNSVSAIECWVLEGPEAAMNRFNHSPSANRESPDSEKTKNKDL